MDTIKVGKFISDMRKAQGLTQEELGEKMGVTNKTISRWETGKYMPDIDKLQELSGLLGVSVNELLSGEKITDAETFMQKADENLVKALAESNAFGLQEKIGFFKKKWLKDHVSYIVGWCVFLSAALVGIIYVEQPLLWPAFAIACLFVYMHIRNRMMIYVEQNVFRK